MKYNSELQSNNSELQEILSIINSLPEAGEDVTLQEKTVTPTKSQQHVTADAGFAGLSSVKVEAIPNEYIVPSGTMNITSNGSYDVTEKASVLVAVEAPTPVLQNKTVTPTTSKQTINADSGYDGLDTVTVNAMPTATQATPSITVSSAGLITASATQTAGYVSAGTKSATKQLTTKGATTITPSTSSQTAVASGVYTTGAITVAAMPTATQATPTISVSTSGLITASSTQSAGYVASGTKSATKQLTVQAAQTITPSTSDKTIASGRYLTGTQTIKGDANLIAANIKKGVSIFGVSGTHEGSTAASDSFSAIPTKYTVKRLSSDVTYGGTTCAQIKFLSDPEIILPSNATQENTAFYWEAGSLSMYLQVKAIVPPSTGWANTKLSDFTFYVDDSSGYVTYGLGVSLGGSKDVVVSNNPDEQWFELSVYVDGREISMRNYPDRSGSSIVVGDGSSSGGGGSVESCTVTFSGIPISDINVRCTGEDMTLKSPAFAKSTKVAKNTIAILYGSGAAENLSLSGACSLVYSYTRAIAVFIEGNCTISFEDAGPA